MRNECMGIINLTRKGEPSLGKMNEKRPIASIPVAGRYRVVDFVMSNMVNSGIKNVGIFAEQKYRSLTDHVGSGKDWDLSRKNGGLFFFSPENTRYYNSNINRQGDIYNLLANIDFIERGEEEYVLISPSYMICNIDYKKALEYHKNSNNDITIIYKNTHNAYDNYKNKRTINIDENNRVVSLGSNLGAFPRANISMEMYIMKREDLLNCVYNIANTGSYSYLEDFIIEEHKNMQVGAYEFDGYLKCIDSVQSYFELSKDILNRDVAKELLYSGRKIFTKEKNESPTIYTDSADVKNSFIATGCVIEGNVENSIIFRKVKVEKGCTIKNSIIMQNCTIEAGSELENVIFDKNINVSEGKVLKGDENYPIVIEKNISM